MNESKLEREYAAYAKSLGGVAYKFVSPSRRNVPDRLTVIQGYLFFIEFKKPGEPLRGGQIREIARLREMGAVVYVVDQPKIAERLLDEILLNGIYPETLPS